MQISYTKSAQHALKYAARAAREMKHPYIGTEHLLLALREEYTGVAGQVLANSGVESEKILKLMDELITPAEEHPAAKGIYHEHVHGTAVPASGCCGAYPCIAGGGGAPARSNGHLAGSDRDGQAVV